jgi:hypothetical protein
MVAVGWNSLDCGRKIGKVDFARGRIGVKDLKMEGNTFVMEEARMMVREEISLVGRSGVRGLYRQRGMGEGGVMAG